jgi:hypothetical protein
MPRASVPEVPGVRIGTVASLALRHYARAVSTRRVVLVSLLVASSASWTGVAYADGSWRDLWLNLLARGHHRTDPENGGRLVSELQEFVGFYRGTV